MKNSAILTTALAKKVYESILPTHRYGGNMLHQTEGFLGIRAFANRAKPAEDNTSCYTVGIKDLRQVPPYTGGAAKVFFALAEQSVNEEGSKQGDCAGNKGFMQDIQSETETSGAVREPAFPGQTGMGGEAGGAGR
jgi:hypothetical protein